MNKLLKKYISIVFIFAIICYYLAYKLSLGHNSPLIPITFSNIITFVILSLIAESSLFPASDGLGISAGFMITIASVLCFNLISAMVIISLGYSFRIIRVENKLRINIFNTQIEKILFNVSNYSISIFTAGACTLVAGSNNPDSVAILFIIFIIFVFVFLAVNAFFISVLMSILRSESFHKIYTDIIKMGFLSVVFIAPLGIILSYFYYKFGTAGAAMFVVPLLLLKYIFAIYV